MIPDFSFEKDGMKAYLEVVGFWTEEYLAKKFNECSTNRSIPGLVLAVVKLCALGRSILKRALDTC
jgi:hypothetical protein